MTRPITLILERKIEKSIFLFLLGIKLVFNIDPRLLANPILCINLRNARPNYFLIMLSSSVEFIWSKRVV